ncbi:hypothetical protein FRC12_019315 [Ceratobasidium sp. 428]|nr:hypothetical protein FRC12_019315 [Ceratobasidium sp. 428]
MFRDNIAMISPSVENMNLETYVLLHPHADRIRLSTDVAEGLAYLHSNEILSSEQLMQANVVVSYGGTAMLTDFGSAIISDAPLQFLNSQARLGRVTKWMAPELPSRANVPNDRSDVYALGMTILVN